MTRTTKLHVALFASFSSFNLLLLSPFLNACFHGSLQFGPDSSSGRQQFWRIDLPSFQLKRDKWEDLVFFIAAVMPSCWDLPAVPSSSIVFLARRCVLSCFTLLVHPFYVQETKKKSIRSFSEPYKCLVGIMTVLVICGNTANKFCGSPQPNANKPVLCSKAEGIVDFTYVTENGAGNVELAKHFLYSTL